MTPEWVDDIIADIADIDDRVNTQAKLLQVHHSWCSLLDQVQTDHANRIERLEMQHIINSDVVRRLVTKVMDGEDGYVGLDCGTQDEATPQEAPPPRPAARRARRCT